MKRNLRIIVVAAIAGAFSAGVMQSVISAFATQNELVPPTSGIFTGVQFSQKIGDAFRSIASGNKGASAPANVGGSAVDGLEWIDDSVTPWVKKRYVNGDWAVEGYFDPTNSSFSAVVGGGLGTIASATTTDLGSVAQANVSITGTTTITGFGSSAKDGVVKFIRFAGALKLTNSTALAIPGGFDLTTAANDRAVVTHLGSGNWEVTSYTRASGIPVDVSAVGKTEFTTAADVPALHLAGDGSAIARASYPAYLAKVTRAQNGTRTSGNATITSVADTSLFGIGMPVEGTGIASGCTIASFVSNVSITLNSSSCVTSGSATVGTITVFLTGYGTGGDGTTVGLPDCVGRKLAGVDPSSSRLSSTFFGVSVGAMNNAGGTQSKNLSIANLDSFTPTVASWNLSAGASVSIPVFNLNVLGGSTDTTHLSLANNANGSAGSFNGSPVTINSTGGGSITMNALGSGTAHSVLDPTLLQKCVTRVTP